jgi:hypothetical protein
VSGIDHDPGNIFLTNGIPVLALDDDLSLDLNKKASALVHSSAWRADGGRTLSAAARRNLGRLSMAELAKESLVADKIATGDWSYTITLKDTGTLPIGTFWFSWVPGKDFMPVTPLSHPAPSGWTDMITNGGPTDGFAILYTASSASSDLQPGQSKLFHFRSSATPAEIFGKSKFYPTELVTTSFVYENAPLVPPGFGPFHSSSNKVIPAAPAPGASTTELLGLNHHGIGDLGNTHSLLAAPAGGLADILASSMPAMSSAEAFGGMSRSGPALDLGASSAVHNQGSSWHG